MGICVNCRTRRVGYSKVTQDAELKFRIFEQEELKGFRKPFNSLAHRGIIENDLISIPCIEEMIRQEFSEAFVTFLNQGYFTTEVNGKKFYDARHFKLLLFLLSSDTVLSGRNVTYHDKAGFLFSYVKVRGDEDLVRPIERENIRFLEVIDDLVEISCILMVKSYLKMKNAKGENLPKLEFVIDKINEHLVNLLFSYKNEYNQNIKHGILTFERLNQLFDEHDYFLTSGYIRDIGWKFVLEGAAYNLEQEEKEEVEPYCHMSKGERLAILEKKAKENLI